MLNYYNSMIIGAEKHRKLMRSADIAVIIREDIPGYTETIFNGLQNHHSVVIIRQDFLFEKYSFLHALGHMIGCSHEPGTGEA